MFNLVHHWKQIFLVIHVLIFTFSIFAGAEPLNDAAKEGDLDKVNRLIQEGANIEVRDASSSTPLYNAVDGGHKELAELLISKGANVNAVDKSGNSPLWWAESGGFKEIMELLVKHGGHK